MAAGEVVEWKDAGYGFIRPDSGARDIFFHAQGLDGWQERPKIGQRVEFQVTQGKKGPQAVGVRLLPGATVDPSGDDLEAGMCDVLTAEDFSRELDEVYAAAKSRLLDIGRRHGWIEG